MKGASARGKRMTEELDNSSADGELRRLKLSIQVQSATALATLLRRPRSAVIELSEILSGYAQRRKHLRCATWIFVLCFQVSLASCLRLRGLPSMRIATTG